MRKKCRFAVANYAKLYCNSDNNFYLYENLGNGIFNIIFAIEINGNEDIINIIRKELKNGTEQNTEDVNTFLEETLRDRQSRNNYGVLGAAKKRGSDERVNSLDGRNEPNESADIAQNDGTSQ